MRRERESGGLDDCGGGGGAWGRYRNLLGGGGDRGKHNVVHTM